MGAYDPRRAPAATPCASHRSHSPEPTYLELHHVIPQAWQRAWTPGQTIVRPGFENALFDPRTVALCRTGHGNTHYWLVRFMRAYSKLTTMAEGGFRIEEACRRAEKQELAPRGRNDMGLALLGMNRWLNAGGSLQALCDAELWGEI